LALKRIKRSGRFFLPLPLFIGVSFFCDGIAFTRTVQTTDVATLKYPQIIYFISAFTLGDANAGL
jgi:glucan biosynthesis protein